MAHHGTCRLIRAFLGLGAGDSDCLYYDVMQFSLCQDSVWLKGKSAVSKMSPDEVNPEWNQYPDKGELDTEGTLKYLAYMLQITQLAIPVTRKNVLYDCRCRIMQATSKDG